MLRSIEMKLFRGIKKGALNDFTPLVVLVGPNGSGKSTVLDAILIGANPHPGDGVGQTVLRREAMPGGAPWLFWKRESEGAALIEVTVDNSHLRACTLSSSGAPPNLMVHCNVYETVANEGNNFPTVGTTFAPDNTYSNYGTPAPLQGVPKVVLVGPISKRLQTPLHEIYSDVVRQGLRGQIKEILANLVPGFQQMEVLTEEGTPVLYLDFADRAVPVALAGDGIASLVRLAFEMVTFPGGIVLMEEPEIHMHPGAIYQLARVIVATVQRDVQIVLTTHSLELIDGLLSEASKAGMATEKMTVYQLLLRDGILKSSRIPGPEVSFARSTIEDDLR